MCQFSEPELDDETSPITQTMGLHAKQHSKRRAAGKPSTAVQHDAYARPSQSETSSVREHCVRGWWRDALCNTSNELNAQLPSFSSHLETLRSAQKRMHLLACKCTQVRLYPNPASTNSKSVLKVQLSALEADMDFYIKSHEMYSAALNIYTVPVQAVVDNLNVSGKECHCTDCARQIERWKTDIHTEIRLEAEGLVNRLHEVNETFKKLYKDLLSKWEKPRRDGLRRMIDALPEQHDLKSKAVVRKYFPRQVREIEEAENKTIRKPTTVRRSDSKLQATINGNTYDSDARRLLELTPEPYLEQQLSFGSRSKIPTEPIWPNTSILQTSLSILFTLFNRTQSCKHTRTHKSCFKARNTSIRSHHHFNHTPAAIEVIKDYFDPVMVLFLKLLIYILTTFLALQFSFHMPILLPTIGDPVSQNPTFFYVFTSRVWVTFLVIACGCVLAARDGGRSGGTG